MQAGALFAAGRSQAQVARQLGVARQVVSRWHARWQAGGQEALRSAGPTGSAPRLSDQQLHLIGLYATKRGESPRSLAVG
jgi:transposase